MIHRVDLVVAALILALCAWLYYVTTTFEQVSDLFAQDIPPEFFPRLLLWFIIVLSVFLPIEHRFLKQGKAGLDKGRRLAIKPMAYITVALLAAVVLFMPWLGTYLALVLVCLLMPPLWGERRWWLVVPYAVIFPTAVTLLFAQGLKVYFEPGVFGLGFR